MPDAAGEPIVVPDRLNLATWFLDERLGEGLGDKTAVFFEDEALSYADLVAESCRVTNLVRALGLWPEDRALFLLQDTPEFPQAFFGALRAGLCAVPASTWLTTDDYAYYLGYVRPKIVFADAAVLERYAPAHAAARHRPRLIVVDRARRLRAGDLPEGARLLHEAVVDHPPEAEPEPMDRDDVAIWLSSSGSTGKPKCVIHQGHDFVFNTIAYAQRTLGIARDDVTLAAPKLFFGYALASNMLFPFSVGASCVLVPHRVRPEEYFALIERYRATQFVTVPTTIAKMLAVEGAEARFDLSSLRGLVSAGEALPARVYRAWKDRFGVEIYDGIGSAEMFHIYITNRPGDVKEGSLGRIVDGYRFRLVDDEDRPVPQGEIGTLVIEGPSAGMAYHRRRDLSRRTFRGDAVRGGDKFFVDADGYFWYCGRGDDMLKCSGVYVSPMEVENCLVSHPAVLEAGVVGYRDEGGLEKAMAFVELRPGRQPSDALAAEIVEHCRAHLAAFKAPRRVRFVESLPRTQTGKIRRAELRKWAEEGP